jgi:nucleotidyltransferase/DNA polymerase involved in DNA repair
MPIPASERRKMLAVRLCGPRVIARLEAIGITKLQDLANRDPDQLVHQVNIAAGRPVWHPPVATQAMTNLISAARDATPDRTHG